MQAIIKNKQYYKFCMYGFFKNLTFFEPFLMLFFIENEISFIQIGSLYAIRELSINILEIPTGFFADVLGRRKTMIFSFLGYIVSFCVFFISTNFVMLVAAMLLFSFGEAMRTGTHKAMIFDYLKMNAWQEMKVIYYGHTRSWSQIGSAVSSLIAAAIVIFSGNYKMVFLFSIVPYLADLVLVASYPKILDGPIKSIESTKMLEKIKQHYISSILSFKRKSVWVALCNLSVFEGYFKATKDYLQPIIMLAVGSLLLLDPEHADTNTALVVGVVYFVIYLVSSLSSRKANWFVGVFKTKQKMLNISLLVGVTIGIASGALVDINYSALATVLFVIIYVVQNIRKPVGISIIADEVKSEVLATGLSVQSQFDSLFAAIFAFTLGVLAEYFSIGLALVILGVSILVLVPFIILKVSFKQTS